MNRTETSSSRATALGFEFSSDSDEHTRTKNGKSWTGQHIYSTPAPSNRLFPACKPCLPLLSTLSTEQLAAAPPAVRRKWGDHPCKFVGFFGDRGARPEELPHDVWAVVPHMAGRGNTRHLPVPWPNGSLPA